MRYERRSEVFRGYVYGMQHNLLAIAFALLGSGVLNPLLCYPCKCISTALLL